ncbi:MAG: ABC transporter permease, partial [Solirubrobacteraceae bacterium]
ALGRPATPRPGWATALARVRLEQLGFWRSRQRAFFSFLMPVLLLVLVGQLDRHQVIGGVRVIEWTVPGFLTFGLAAAIYNNLAVTITEQREAGILKRVRATPVPARAFIVGQLGSSLIVGACLTGVFVLAARALFGIGFPAGHLLAFVVTVLAGTACFAAWGLAITAAIRSAEAAVPVANATYVPLALVSGVFFPGQGGPSWLVGATRAMPMRPLAEALHSALQTAPGLALRPERLAVLVAWAVVGALCAARFFRWVPTRSAA